MYEVKHWFGGNLRYKWATSTARGLTQKRLEHPRLTLYDNMDLLADAEMINEEAVIIEEDVSVPKPVRKTRFNFTPETDLVLLSEVQVCRAYIAGWILRTRC